ncbi:uncharacterized protein isoform X2 [Danio rerio]|uniref:Uncharacterized protein isoform X2 n=1 Tax=Danio rerio TaxID=7955 RepID=A0AC58J169_DANRE
MELLLFIFAAVIPVDGFTVRGPSAPLSAPLGSSVVLPCYVDEALPVEDLEVEWRRADSETLIHLYQDGESRAEVQQQDYHDRAHFFTEEIQHGNFSLRLDNLTAQDEGEYRCRVHSQQDSGETVAQIKDVERLLVSGSDESISAYAGEDVTLNCSVDSHITPEYIEEVSWKKTDKDGDFPVLLYQNNETVSEATHDKFRGRVEFFTAEIPKGNFSLRLKSVRTEDKGVYMCQVFAGDLSASVTVVLKRLGFSVLHIIMMILCVSASGSALLLCFMIYCRSTTKGIIQPFVSLGSSVVLPCYVDKPVKHLKVEWKRADLDSDSETLVHLYQDGESRAEVQQQDYHDRAHFFTEEIQHGNFSLRLDNLGTEDAGEYRCRVHSQHNHVFSTKVILELEYDHSSSLAGFMVKTPSGPLVIPLGSSVILPCYCNKDLADLRVEWRRSDSETLVHLYQDGESQPEEQDEDEQNRAHFFTEQIQHGNFSLRLNNLTAEDKGEYTCTVYSQQNAVFSTKTNLEVGILDAYFHLQMFLVICPNMIMSCAFALWGISEGSLNESVSCCALYFLRPLLLLWAAPFISNFTGNIKTLILKYSYVAEYVSLSIVIYTALFATAFEKLVNYAEFEKHMIIVLFAVVFLCCLCKIVYSFTVRGPSAPLSAPLGSSVVLPCYVDKALPVEDLEVEWRRADSETLVHLYQDGESRAEVQQQDYHDRAHFFTEKIQHGNFSLRLDNLTAQDEGEYRCRVHSQQDSGQTVAQIKDVERLLVSGSDASISAYAGEDVTLNCSVDSHITPEHIKVSWSKIHKDGDILVLLFQNNETLPDSSHEQFRGRVEFFTAEIPKGNFSLRLKSVRTEDKEVYMCQVFAGGASANATVELERLGFSAVQVIMMILCVSASGSALLLCFMIYCRSPSKDPVFQLQMILVFCPNILMFVAFVLWGVSEGSLFESVSCCALYFLRPLMLLWVAPYVTEFTGNIKTFMELFSFKAEYVVFSAVFYSVLFKSVFDKGLSYAGFESVVIIVLFVTVLLFNLIFFIFFLDKIIEKLSQRIQNIFDVLAGISFDVLPSLQFILLFFAFGSAGAGFFILAVLPVFLKLTNYNWDVVCGKQMGCLPSVRRSVWLILMLLINALMVYFYIIALENEKDRVGWACMIAFLQLLWAVMDFTRSFKWILPRVVPVYVFGSVAVVLLNSVTLMTELILKTVYGEGAIGDLRIVVFSSEYIFTLSLMILLVFEPWIKTWLQSCQKAVRSCQTPAAGSQNQDIQNAEESDGTPASGLNQKPEETSPLLHAEDLESVMKPKKEMWKCVVLCDYTPEEDDKLKLVKGETIEILAKDENSWWMGKKNNQIGLFQPTNVKEIAVSSEDAAGSDESPASGSNLD